jgi:hypothetical protein
MKGGAIRKPACFSVVRSYNQKIEKEKEQR